MKIINLFLFLVIITLNSSDVFSQFLIKKGQVGNLKIGNSADLIYHEYDFDQTNLVDLFLEGFYTPAIQILNVSGIVEFTAEIDCGKIYRFKVFDEKYHTAEGIKVGSTVSDVVSKFKIQNDILIGETGYFIYSDELKISFELNAIQLRNNNIEIDNSSTVADLPKDIEVFAIIII